MNIKRFLNYLICVLGFIFISYTSFSQKCKYEKNEIDGLMEVAIKLTKQELLCRIDNQPVFIKTQCIGNNKYLKVRYFKYQDFIIQENKELILVLSSQEEISLSPKIMSKDSNSVNELAEVSTMLVYKITSSQFQKLINNSVQKIQYYISTGFVEKSIKSSKQDLIMKLLRCVE